MKIKFPQPSQNQHSLISAAQNCLHTEPAVVFAYLFGSLAAGVRKPFSDVDIAVYIGEGENFGERKLEILGKLADILGTDEIDVVVLNTASLPLVMNVLKKNRVLVDKQPYKRHAYESLVMRKHFDFSIKESALLRRRYLDGR